MRPYIDIGVVCGKMMDVPDILDGGGDPYQVYIYMTYQLKEMEGLCLGPFFQPHGKPQTVIFYDKMCQLSIILKQKNMCQQ